VRHLAFLGDNMSDTTTDHNIALELTGDIYTLTISGPVDAIDNMLYELQQPRFEQLLLSAIQAKAQELRGE
jgi:hypothetical protein